MKKIILKNDLNKSLIKKYFNYILELKKSGEKFPVDLDEVWMLVYSEKGKAVRALKDNTDFVEGIDYQVLAKNGKNPKGGRPTEIYKLSVSCLEYFIVRKIRTVFEVYQTVFFKYDELTKQLEWHGLPTVYFKGDVYVNYKAGLRELGYSTISGAVQSRKRNRPDMFTIMFNQNWIKVDYANLLAKQSEIRQLQIEFKELEKKIGIKL